MEEKWKGSTFAGQTSSSGVSAKVVPGARM